MADDEGAIEDRRWVIELEEILPEINDIATLKTITRSRPVPPQLRSKIWQICLNIVNKGNPFTSFDELFDLPEQTCLREDCQAIVARLGNADEEKLSVVSDLESILTFYCKSRSLNYDSDNGWTSVLQLLLALKYTKAELYNSFYAVVSKYIPKNCVRNGKPFQLFRLLLLYHDPELCNFLDTKRISPDAYAKPWFLTVFAGSCQLNVVLNMWDVYLQSEDQFLVFFLALVILVNARDQILAMETSTKHDIIAKLRSFPNELEADDIEDFCTLAQYYASKTPQSFRQNFHSVLFGTTLASQKADADYDVHIGRSLCLTVLVEELLQAVQQASILVDGLRYFLIDCRPAEQYNAGHLPTAFHLDANLMLQSPSEFMTAVQALLATQEQALTNSAAAAGEHLCFVGSGREDEDQYVHMVVAHFLQRHSQYVSIVCGGYAALHDALKDNLNHCLRDHNPSICIACNPNSSAASSSPEHNGYDRSDEPRGNLESSLLNRFGKLSSVMKSTSAVVKEKMINYIKNEQTASERHVSASDRVGKRYRNMASIFSIGDGDEDNSDDEKEMVNVDAWMMQAEVKTTFECQEVLSNGFTHPSRLCVSDSYLIVLRDIAEQKGCAWIQSRRPLNTILKITSKKHHPEFITFKYGSSIAVGDSSASSSSAITSVDRFIIPQAGEATKYIKQQIMKVLEALET